MRRAPVAFSACLALFVMTAAPSWGQPAPNPVSGFDSGFGFRMGVRYETWDEDGPGPAGEPLGQVTSYLLVNHLLPSGLRIDAALGWSATDQEGFERFSTFRDSKLSLSQRIGEHLIVAGGVSIPTGTTGLEFSELALAQRVASRIKGYSTPKFGEGLNVNGRVVYGHKFHEAHLSFGLGYLNRGTYDIYATLEDYDPGDQLTASAGIDFVTDTRSWRSQVDYTHFQPDRLQEDEVFEFGDRVRLESAYSRSSGELFWQARARAFFQAEPASEDSVRSVDPEASESRDWEFYGDLSFDRGVSERVYLLGSAGLRLLGERAGGGGDGHRFDIGGGVRVPMSLVSVIAQGRYGWGSLTPPANASNQDDISLQGFAVELSIERKPW